MTADAGVYDYLYPGSRKAVGVSENYYEVYADLAKPFGPVTTKVGINWARRQAYFRNFATPTRYSVYVYGELGYAPANMPFLIHSDLGHTAGGLDFANRSYLDYTVGAIYKWKAVLFDLSLVGTDISRKTPFRSARITAALPRPPRSRRSVLASDARKRGPRRRVCAAPVSFGRLASCCPRLSARPCLRHEKGAGRCRPAHERFQERMPQKA